MHVKLVWGIIIIISGLSLTLHCISSFSELNFLDSLVTGFSDIVKSSPENQYIKDFEKFKEKQRLVYSIFAIIGVLMAVYGTGWVGDYSEDKKEEYNQLLIQIRKSKS